MALAVGASAAQAQSERTILLVPGSSDDLLGTMALVIKPGLEDALEKPVDVAIVLGEDGGVAQDLAGRLPPDGDSLLVAELLTRAIDEALPDADQETTLNDLTPIVKLAQAISVALIVPEGSPLQDFDDFAEAAAQHKLTVSTFGRHSSSGVGLAMIARFLDLPFVYAERDSLSGVLRDIDSGLADAALVFTRVLTFPELTGRYRALATFGADRSPLLQKRAPTFAEISGDRKNAFTTSVALFGPPGMTDEVVARISAAFFRGVSTDQDVMETAARRGIDIVLKDDDVVVETMARDRNVVERVLPLLE